MRDELVWTRGRVVQGYRVASGLVGDPRFPDGTITPQLSAFRERTPDFDAYLGGPVYPGTINVAVRGATQGIRFGDPDLETGPIAWTDVFGAENFLISRCVLEYAGLGRPAYIYLPDPLTKPDHPLRDDVVEVLTTRVPDIAYGAAVAIGHRPGLIKARRRSPGSGGTGQRHTPHAA